MCALGTSAIVSGSVRMLRSACANDVADAVVLAHVARGASTAAHFAADMDAEIVGVVESDEGTVTITVRHPCGDATSSAVGATAVSGD